MKRLYFIVLITIFNLVIPMTVIAGPGDSPEDPVTANLGINTGTLASEEAYFYFSFDATGSYVFILEGPDDTDFDMEISNAATNERITGAYEIVYPDETYVFDFYGELLIAVYSFDGAGDFTLEIEETDETEVTGTVTSTIVGPQYPDIASVEYSSKLKEGDSFRWEFKAEINGSQMMLEWIEIEILTDDLFADLSDNTQPELFRVTESRQYYDDDDDDDETEVSTTSFIEGFITPIETNLSNGTTLSMIDFFTLLLFGSDEEITSEETDTHFIVTLDMSFEDNSLHGEFRVHKATGLLVNYFVEENGEILLSVELVESSIDLESSGLSPFVDLPIPFLTLLISTIPIVTLYRRKENH